MLVTTAELSRDDLTKGLRHAMPSSERDADDQITSARRAAHEWLRATLASLPDEVVSLSVGAVFSDANDVARIDARIKAEVCTPEVTLRYPDDYPSEEMEPLDAIDDGLAEMTRPFLFALRDEEWLTVTRADIAAPTETTAVDPAILFHHGQRVVSHQIDAMLSLRHDPTERRWISTKNSGDIPLPATTPSLEALVLAAIVREIIDLPRGSDTTLRVYRSADGDLTWTVAAP